MKYFLNINQTHIPLTEHTSFNEALKRFKQAEYVLDITTSEVDFILGQRIKFWLRDKLDIQVPKIKIADARYYISILNNIDADGHSFIEQPNEDLCKVFVTNQLNRGYISKEIQIIYGNRLSI